MDSVELLRQLRGCVNDPVKHLKWLCHASGAKWETTDHAADQVLAGTVDGVPLVVTRKEWLPLNEEQGLDLLGRKLKEALP